MLMKEVKTFCLCDLIQFLKAEQADDTPDQDNISDLRYLSIYQYCCVIHTRCDLNRTQLIALTGPLAHFSW